MRSHATAALIPVLLALAGSEPAAALVQPERMEPIKPQSGDGGRVCGVAGDFNVSGEMLRVEVGTIRSDAGASVVLIRAYVPNAVGPVMRDLWLKTPTIFSLGRFKPARENGNGILEVRGPVDAGDAAAVLAEIAAGDVEVSIVFDGPMPAARFPVGLPRPLPIDLAGALDDCAGGAVPR